MIDLLLLTNERDYSIDRVIRWLGENEPQIRIERVNRESLSPIGDMSATLDQLEWRVRQAPRVAWLRQFLPERDPFGRSPTTGEIDDILVARRQWLTWFHLFEHVGTRWFNDPARAYHAESKVRQLAVAGRLGFDVPPTLLTTDRGSALAFDALNGPCVVKSVASAFWEFSDQSLVFTMDAQQALAADSGSWQRQPVLVQQRIDGTHDARLFVIGDSVVAAMRPRDSLDWRTDGAGEWSPWRPDQRTTELAVAFVREFGLEYGAFDFILGSEEHVGPVFLECNPSGEFGFLDDVLGQAPSQLIGQVLAGLASDGRSVGSARKTPSG